MSRPLLLESLQCLRVVILQQTLPGCAEECWHCPLDARSNDGGNFLLHNFCDFFSHSLLVSLVLLSEEVLNLFRQRLGALRRGGLLALLSLSLLGLKLAVPLVGSLPVCLCLCQEAAELLDLIPHPLHLSLQPVHTPGEVGRLLLTRRVESDALCLDSGESLSLGHNGSVLVFEDRGHSLQSLTDVPEQLEETLLQTRTQPCQFCTQTQAEIFQCLEIH
mmetsp:Transcript_55997/g.109612  ORF Transcript_55997/g.109612 Transcript_55997/m.109612 type:complete len:219 (-) Transcript_55997:1306-1962(-)